MPGASPTAQPSSGIRAPGPCAEGSSIFRFSPAAWGWILHLGYQAALAALREDTQAWWADVLARNLDELEEGDEPATADAEGLRRFLEAEVLSWFEMRKKELSNRPLIREQAFGESLDPEKLERLARYEVHLDRKLERTLAMLFRLKELRPAAAESESVWQNRNQKHPG
jgi:hypothetical protein